MIQSHWPPRIYYMEEGSHAFHIRRWRLMKYLIQVMEKQVKNMQTNQGASSHNSGFSEEVVSRTFDLIHRASGKNQQTVQKGDVIIIHDDVPCVTWRLAIIEDLIVGGDRLIWAATLRTANRTTSRPITKLYPLELNERRTLDLRTRQDESEPETEGHTLMWTLLLLDPAEYRELHPRGPAVWWRNGPVSFLGPRRMSRRTNYRFS